MTYIPPEQQEALSIDPFLDMPPVHRGKPHDWRKYISEDMRKEWSTFTDRQKIIIATNAQNIADDENWD